MIKEFILKRILIEAYTLLKNGIKDKFKDELVQDIKLEYGDIQLAINSHIKYIENFSKTISIRDEIENRSLFNSYIDLDIRLTPVKWSVKDVTFFETKKLFELFSYTEHYVILGGPGAGKSTALKKLCQDIIHEDLEYLESFNFPILIRLRDSKSHSGIRQTLQEILPINVKINNKKSTRKVNNTISNLMIEYYDNLNMLLLIDGFDELPIKKRIKIADEIEFLANSFTQSKIVLTSRSSAFDYSLDNTRTFEICQLTKPQKEIFTDKWFNNAELASSFKKQAKDKPFYDTLGKPLNLSYLCALFRKYRSIPDQPKIIYKKIIRLLLEEWDFQNRVYRDSSYTNLEIETKEEFFSNLAYNLSIDYQEKVYSEEQIKKIYKKIHSKFGFSIAEMPAVLNELETHTGLFIKSSYDTYEFDHKSIQEYLAAQYIINLGYIPIQVNLPNEYAIATSLAFEPENFMERMILHLTTDKSLSSSFVEEYLSRLLDENIKFSGRLKFILSIYYLYSICYVKIFEGSYLFTLIDEYDKGEYEIGRIFSVLFTKDYFQRSLEEFKEYFYSATTNSRGVILLCLRKDVQIEKIAPVWSKKAKLLKSGLRMNQKYFC